jgi:hypothetical protein
MKNSRQVAKLTLVFGIVLMASGCGSSAEPVVAVQPDIPSEATASVPALISFAILKTSTGDETEEPLDVGLNDLATSETEEPDPNV